MKTDLQNKKTEKVRLDRTGATYSSSISAKKNNWLQCNKKMKEKDSK